MFGYGWNLFYSVEYLKDQEIQIKENVLIWFQILPLKLGANSFVYLKNLSIDIKDIDALRFSCYYQEEGV